MIFAAKKVKEGPEWEGHWVWRSMFHIMIEGDDPCAGYPQCGIMTPNTGRTCAECGWLVLNTEQLAVEMNDKAWLTICNDCLRTVQYKKEKAKSE
jgi:hypothetical protein